MWPLEVTSHIETIYLLTTCGLSDTAEVSPQQNQVAPGVVWMADVGISGVLNLDLTAFYS